MDAAREVSATPDRLLLRPSKRKWILLLVVFIAFVATGVWMINVGGPVPRAPIGDARFWGWVSVIFFGLGIPLSFIQLFSSSMYLSLTPERFTMGTLWGTRTIRWSDVTSFTAEQVAYRSKMVKFDYVPANSEHSSMRAVARSLSGHDAGLPDTYGMKAEDLAALMNAWRSRYAHGASE
ncbi:MAG: hypothetical protein E6J05_14190 [Chloroflexi bacterium]|nr:MAG: hypothetical protein E6J05_14190 [Chloroflexota bacterium]